MVYLLGWSLLLLFGVSGIESLSRAPQENTGNEATSSFERTSSKMVTNKRNGAPETEPMRNVNVKENNTASHIQTSTHATTVISKLELQGAKNKRKNTFTPVGLSTPNGELDPNARTRNVLVKDESTNVFELSKRRQVPSNDINLKRRRKSRGETQKSRKVVNKNETVCEEPKVRTRRGNNGCTNDTLKIIPFTTAKYITQAFPFVVNLISIGFYIRRLGKSNVPMYVIAMNLTELISVLLAFSWLLVHKNGWFSRANARNQITGPLMPHVSTWVKQGSYVIHLLLTIERFQVVKYPMHYLHIWNVSKGKLVMFVAVLFFVISHVIGVSISATLRHTYDRNLFYEWNATSGGLFIVLPVTVIVILNTATSIVFHMETSAIKKSSAGATLQQLLKRDKRQIISLTITTTVLILTSTPSSLFVMFIGPNQRPDMSRKLLEEGLATLSYFGNGIAFIILMSLSVADRKLCCPCCVTSE